MKSIKTKLVAFALFSTLAPSLVLGLIAHLHNQRSMEEHIDRELNSLASLAKRELELWFSQQARNVRAFADSRIVKEGVRQGRYGAEAPAPDSTTEDIGGRLERYLASIHGRFPSYRSLVVVDAEGLTLGSSPTGARAPARLPAHWSGSDPGKSGEENLCHRE